MCPVNSILRRTSLVGLWPLSPLVCCDNKVVHSCEGFPIPNPPTLKDDIGLRSSGARTSYCDRLKMPLSTSSSAGRFELGEADYHHMLGASAVDMASNDSPGSVPRESPNPTVSLSTARQFIRRSIPDPLGEISEQLTQAEVEQAEALLSQLRTLAATRGLRGLGLINVPELTVMMSTATLVSPPVTPNGQKFTKPRAGGWTSSAPAPEPVLRLPRRMRARLFIADMGEWVRMRVKRMRMRTRMLKERRGSQKKEAE